MSVTNNKLQVATKGSGHQATTEGATDVCYDKTKATTAPYDNYDPTLHLKPGTSKTFIEDAAIWNKSHILAAPSLPAHDGKGGGVVSGTYIDIAAPTMCSPDCKAEGDGVIRSTDTTTQNKANTVGMVTMMTAEQKLQMAQDLVAGLDKLVKVDGICADGRILDIPRGGKRTGELLYLEILNEDNVVFRATRENAIHGGDPECRVGNHTLWRVSRSGMAELEQSGDFFAMPGSFTEIPGFEKSQTWKDQEAQDACDVADEKVSFEPTSREKHDAEPEVEEEEGRLEYKGLFGERHDQDDIGARMEADEKRYLASLKNTLPEEKGIAHKELTRMPEPTVTGINPPPPPKKNPTREERRAHERARDRYDDRVAQERRRIKESRRKERFHEAQLRAKGRAQEIRDQYNKKVARRTALLQSVKAGSKNLVLFRKLWNAHHNPPEIHVTATACSGSKMAIIKVFPAGKHTFDLFSDAISTSIEAFRRVALGVKGTLETLGCDFVVELLVDPIVQLELEYRELFEDSINGLTTGSVNLAWALEMSFEKYIYGFVEWDCPLDRAVAAIPPLSLLLKVVELASWWFETKYKAVAYFKVELDWKFGIVVECDEYDATFVYPVTGLKLVFEVGAKVPISTGNEVGICAFVELSAEIDDGRASREGILQVHAKGGFKLALKGWVHVDFWCIRENCDLAFTLYETSLGDRWFQPVSPG